MTTRDDLALAHRLADAAATAIRPFFRARYDMEFKSDKSPVTEADRAAEAAIRAILEKERPQDGIIGEEYGATREDAERVWILDPIDGTRSFIAGRPIFGTLIALTQTGWPTIGIIDQPIANERWAGMMGRLRKRSSPAPGRNISRPVPANIFPALRANAGIPSGVATATIMGWSRQGMWTS
jgi:fructose-1,6-bisphosphatase/inositol monophosphatase family enzyme